jgi:hypothetical protein
MLPMYALSQLKDGELVHFVSNPEYPSPTHPVDSEVLNIYPIITYAELDENPESILENTDLVYSRMSNRQVKNVAKVMHDLDASLVRATDSATNLFSNTHESLTRLLSTQDELRRQVIREAKTNPGSEAHQKLQQTVYDRDQHLATLNNIYTQLDSIAVDLAKITQSMDEARMTSDQDKLESNVLPQH